MKNCVSSDLKSLFQSVLLCYHTKQSISKTSISKGGHLIQICFLQIRCTKQALISFLCGLHILLENGNFFFLYFEFKFLFSLFKA